MNARISERLEPETRLRRALERNEFCLYYQPKIDLASGTIVGMEALIRWIPEKGRIVPPLDFIPLLEETGLIVPVGEWVIREACRQNREWHLAGLENLVVSTNMSARQFYQGNLPEVIAQILRETSLEPKYLKIELTESIVMQDIDMAVGILNRLKEMGLSLSIDDFGTGYSSLAYLKRFPVDELKIDKSFVNGLGTDLNDSTIVNTIISMAHSMRLKVVAEGVETADQLELLRERSCEEVQGFYFSKPLAPGLFEEMMRSTTNMPH
jgi:EAL domain-containing protein (putative c-di-GMP-specific phosphodiesterase class I)